MAGDITKLPKWAQERIGFLEGALRRAQERYEELTACLSGRQKTRIKVDRGLREGDFYLPETSEIVFILPNGNEVGVRFPYSNRGPQTDRFEIRSNGRDELFIRPHVSNVIEIFTADRMEIALNVREEQKVREAAAIRAAEKIPTTVK